MKESELRERGKCAHCQRLIGETGLPLFYTLRIERHGLNAPALQRQTGLAMMLGNAALAQVMGPDEEMTMPLMEPATITICEVCSREDIPVMQLAEYAIKEVE